MKGEFGRRVVVILLCVLAVVVVCIGVSAGTATDAEAALPTLPHKPTTSTTWGVVFPPNVTDVDPGGGLTTGGEVVVITGTFFERADGVTFGGTPATSFTVDSATQITAVAPMHAAGTVQVKVIVGAWESADTSADDYTYVEPPPTTEPPTTAAPATEPPSTTAALTETSVMETTTVAPMAEDEGEDGGGLSGGWIAFIVVIAVGVVGGMGAFAYRVGKKSK